MIKSDDPKYQKQSGRKDGAKDDPLLIAIDKLVVYAASKDGAIRELIHGKSRSKYETGYHYSHLCMIAGGSAFFGGVGNHQEPGAIHVITHPFDENSRVQELQVHESPISRMALNYEHNLLFSGADDGSLAIMAIHDKPKGSLLDMIYIKEVLVPGKFYRKLEEEIKETNEELIERRKDSSNRVKAIRNEKEREID